MARRPRLKHLSLATQEGLSAFQRNHYSRLISARTAYDQAADRADFPEMKRALAAERRARKWLRIAGVSLREGRASLHRGHSPTPGWIVSGITGDVGVIPPGTVVDTPPIPWRPDQRRAVEHAIHGETQETHSTACWDCGRLVQIEDTYSPKAKLDSPFEQRPAYCQGCFQKEEAAGRAKLVEN